MMKHYEVRFRLTEADSAPWFKVQTEQPIQQEATALALMRGMALLQPGIRFAVAEVSHIHEMAPKVGA